MAMAISAHEGFRLHAVSQTVKDDVRELAGSGQYCITPKIYNELCQIDKGINHIKLNENIVQSSQAWREKTNNSAGCNERKNQLSAVEAVSGAVRTVKGSLNERSMKSKVDNEVRETHFKNLQNLQSATKSLTPHMNRSIDSIDQFCDFVGVTDRYTGYRTNLSRGKNDPIRLGRRWLSNEEKDNGIRVATSMSAVPKSVSNCKFREPTGSSSRSAVPIQERCGIITRFPQDSEYMIRYTARARPNAIDFTINPSPNFFKYSRPLGLPEFYRSQTEFQSRYHWPIEPGPYKLPWLKK